ncbi:hypothetical protein WDW89_11255 [Deltaproteobacteria bacterium TL4]
MQIFDEIAQRAWLDESFKKTLMEQPKAVLETFGFEPNQDTLIEVHDDSLNQQHFVLLEKDQIDLMGPFGETLYVQASRRAHEDAEFKSRLLKHPHSALQEITNTPLPDNLRVFENTPNHIHIVLPANPHDRGELSDIDLISVIGGKGLSLGMSCTVFGYMFNKTGTKFDSATDIFGDESKFGGFLAGLGPMLTGAGTMTRRASTVFSK